MPKPDIPEGFEDVTEKKDKGIMKLITRQGTGEEKPNPNDRVTVHYVGTFWGGEQHGQQFDSSRDRGEPFSFDLLQGNVIKGWDWSVGKMLKGEICEIILSPYYGYDKRGSPPMIPPNQELKFEIELIDWVGEDLSREKDGSVRRSVMKKGESYETPNDEAYVEIDLVGRLQEDMREFDNRSVSYTLGEFYDHELPTGLEIALKRMKKNETARIIVQGAKAFPHGCEKLQVPVPAGAALVYEVLMKHFENSKESWQMDRHDKLEQAQVMRQKGALACKASQWERALICYKKVASHLDYSGDFTEEEAKAKREQLLLACHLNMALCHLKLKDYASAKEQCNKALGFDPNSEKAFYRRAQSWQGVKDWEEAVKDFEVVLSIDATNTAAQKQLAFCKDRIKDQNARDKRIFAHIFNQLAAESNAAPDSESGSGSVESSKKESGGTGTGSPSENGTPGDEHEPEHDHDHEMKTEQAGGDRDQDQAEPEPGEGAGVGAGAGAGPEVEPHPHPQAAEADA